jgi:hypothetical protein
LIDLRATTHENHCLSVSANRRRSEGSQLTADHASAAGRPFCFLANATPHF